MKKAMVKTNSGVEFILGTRKLYEPRRFGYSMTRTALKAAWRSNGTGGVVEYSWNTYGYMASYYNTANSIRIGCMVFVGKDAYRLRHWALKRN